MENIIRKAIVITILDAIKNKYVSNIRTGVVSTENDRGLDYYLDYHPHQDKNQVKNEEDISMFEIVSKNETFCTITIPEDAHFCIKSKNHAVFIKINDLQLIINQFKLKKQWKIKTLK